jgi:hypothetical protein
MVRLQATRVFGSLVCVACSSITGSNDTAGACRQTYEFGNYGCILIAGSVTVASAQSLSGTYVSIGNGGDRGQFGGGFDTTTADGRYQLRAIRVLRDRGSTDSVTLWIHAVRIPRSGSPSQPSLHDSSVVRLVVTPIGAVPSAAIVNLRLPAF